MTKELTKQETTALAAAVNFEEDAGQGFEGTTADSYATPFLKLLQSNSPQLDPDSPTYVKGAIAGDFVDSVSGKIHKNPLIVAVRFDQMYLHWKSIDQGGGFLGTFSMNDPVVQTTVRNSDTGRLEFDDGTYLSDTKTHFCLLLDEEEGTVKNIIISLASTQIKKSKKWMSEMSGIRFVASDGSKYNPASYAHLYRLSSQGEVSKKTGNRFKGWNIERQCRLDSANPFHVEAYLAAKALHKLVEEKKLHSNLGATDNETDSDF